MPDVLFSAKTNHNIIFSKFEFDTHQNILEGSPLKEVEKKLNWDSPSRVSGEIGY
jgi:hypothetical protein